MNFLQKLIRLILIVRISMIPVVGSLIFDGDPAKHQSEYAEFKRYVGLMLASKKAATDELNSTTATTTTAPISKGKDVIQYQPQIQAPFAIPSIQLCRDKPADDNIFGYLTNL